MNSRLQLSKKIKQKKPPILGGFHCKSTTKRPTIINHFFYLEQLS